jgi:nitroreductase
MRVMDAIEALKTRRSVRKFTGREITRSIIEDIIDTGRLAPSANNVQSWEFVVVSNQKTREEIAKICDYGKFIKDAPVCVAVFCKDTKYFLEDGCASTENILVAARSYGIGSCWVAGDKKAYAPKIGELLKVPSSYKLISILALGYTDQKIEPHGKRALRDVIHWEEF